MYPQNYMYAQTKDEVNTKVPEAIKLLEKKNATAEADKTKLAQMGPYDMMMMQMNPWMQQM